MADASRPTLSETGQIYVTATAAKRFVEACGYKEHEVEAARRELTELLLDARQRQGDPRMWRARKRSTKLDISALVQPEGRLLVVTFVSVQPYDPPSRTSGVRKGTRSRFPGGSLDGSPDPTKIAGGRPSGPRAGRRGGRRV